MPKYQHYITCRISIVSIIVMFIVNIMVLISDYCIEPSLIGLLFALILSILEFPLIITNSKTCTTFSKKLETRKGFIVRIIMYLTFTVSLCLLYNNRYECWIYLFNGFFILMPVLGYILSLCVYRENGAEKDIENNSLNDTS